MTPLGDAVLRVRQREAWAHEYWGDAAGYADWAPVARLLPAAWAAGEIDPEQLAPLLRSAWLRIWPFDAVLAAKEWRALFDAVGYREDIASRPRPSRPLRLYRGACAARRSGWSWTPDLSLAAKFTRYAASSCGRSARAAVWTAEVQPFRLLARYDDAGAAHEYVIDTECLVIEPTPARVAPA